MGSFPFSRVRFAGLRDAGSSSTSISEEPGTSSGMSSVSFAVALPRGWRLPFDPVFPLGRPFRPSPFIEVTVVLVALVALVAVVKILSPSTGSTSPRDINDGASENAVKLDCRDKREAFDACEVRPFFVAAFFFEPTKTKK